MESLLSQVGACDVIDSDALTGTQCLWRVRRLFGEIVVSMPPAAMLTAFGWPSIGGPAEDGVSARCCLPSFPVRCMDYVVLAMAPPKCNWEL